MIRFLIPALLLLLMPFQNCSGFRSPASLQDPYSPDDTPLTEDPLLVGSSLQGSAYPRDRYTNNNVAQSVTIRALDSSGYLSNGYINIKADSQFPSQIAVSSSNFNYATGTPQFRQTNSYYHSIRLIALYKELGFDLNNLVNIKIDTHCEAPSNAYFNSAQNRVCMGYVDLSPRRYAADDADVMIHELNHAVNRVLSDNDIMSSSPEIGAIDEGTSDFWANMLSDSPELSPYYGRAIWQKAYNTVVNAPLRTTEENPLPHYPESLDSEVHYDGVIFNSALWAIYKALPSGQISDFKKAVGRTIQAAQNRDGFKQLAKGLIGEAMALGVDTSIIQTKLTDFGLYRTDDLNQLSIPSSGFVRIIDEPISGFSSVGNCNKTLEVDEEVLVVFNFNNTGVILGSVTAELVSADPGLEVIPGGDYGTYLRFLPNKNFIASLPTSGSKSSLGSYRYGAIVASAFAFKALTAGTSNVRIRLKSYSSSTGTTQSREVDIPITVAAASSVKTCSSGQDGWP